MTACVSDREFKKKKKKDKVAGNAMFQACKGDHHEDALALLCVSKMVRKDML